MDRIPIIDFEDMEHGRTYLWYRNTNDIDFAWLSDDGNHLITPQWFNDSKPDYWKLSAGLIGVLYGPVNIETAIKPEENEDTGGV